MVLQGEERPADLTPRKTLVGEGEKKGLSSSEKGKSADRPRDSTRAHRSADLGRKTADIGSDGGPSKKEGSSEERRGNHDEEFCAARRGEGKRGPGEKEKRKVPRHRKETKIKGGEGGAVISLQILEKRSLMRRGKEERPSTRRRGGKQR